MTALNTTPTSPIPARRVHIPIRIKITVPYMILSLLVAAAVAYLTTQLVIENIQERFDKQLYEAGKISSELIVSYETQLLETQRLLANVQGISDAILANDPHRLRSLTLGIVANDQQEAVELIDLQGNHVLSLHHRQGSGPEDYLVSSGGPTAFASLDIVQNIFAQKHDSLGDKFADLIQTDAGSFLYVSGPIYDQQGNLAGVVLVGKSLSTLTTEMRARTFAQISFYDTTGSILYSTLPFPQSVTFETAARTLSLKDVSSLKRDLSVSNIAFTEILGAWEVRGNHELGILGVALSQNSVVEASTGSRWRIFGLAAAANLLIILVGLNVANTITRPLIQLVGAAIRVSKGDMHVQVDMHTNDELSILTESFNAMVTSLHQSQQDLLKSYDSTLEGWARALELRDKETEGHSERVTRLTVRLAEVMGIEGDALVHIRRGALLHDIGKMGIPDAILHKNGSLNAEELAIIRKHPMHAHAMLKGISFLQPALAIPICHHEKWDGTGYPQGLRGEAIPIEARIFAIVDVWDALISDRPYRQALRPDDVIAYLRDQSGRHFDPRVVDAFQQVLDSIEKADA